MDEDGNSTPELPSEDELEEAKEDNGDYDSSCPPVPETYDEEV